jgi:hypothetical protein
LKRRVERKENKKRKDPKTIEKKNKKKLGRMVAPVHNFDPQIIAGRISEAVMGGAGGRWTSYFMASVVLWKEKCP